MKFQMHPSDKMVELFSKRPFQGQVPEKASIVFLSSDANYSPEISNHPFFDHILEYQKDGVAFWKKHRKHHPFLLPTYPFNRNVAGVPFHRNFSKLGLGPEWADQISFLELLDLPTIGNKSEDREAFLQLLSIDHLKYLESIITGGRRKLIFVSSGVLRDILFISKSYPVFGWIDRRSCQTPLDMTINGNRLKEIYHFSSSQIHGQLMGIKFDMAEWAASVRLPEGQEASHV